MINEQRKKMMVQVWGMLGAVLFYGLYYFAESHQARSIIGVILGIVSLASGLIVFKSIGLKCLTVMLAPEHVTAYFDGFAIGTKNRWIEYHYIYRGTQYTGKGLALTFNELTSPNTPFPLRISRINPRFSWHGDPRIGILPPLLFLVVTVAASIFFVFISPNFPRYNVSYERFHEAPTTRQPLEHIKPIEWSVDGLHISATGITEVPKAFKGSALQTSLPPLTTLHIENHSHVPIQIDRVQHDGTNMPSWYVPPRGHCEGHLVSPGGHCDEQLFPPIFWRFMSGKTVLGVLASTSQAGYVTIRDTQ